MGTFAKGDIVLFPFPYTDLSNRKLRPCLVISDEMGDDILLCQITSQHLRRDRYTLGLQADSTLDGSLAVDSYIRTNIIFTAAKNQIHRTICRVPDHTYSNVTEMISKIIRK